MNHPKGILELSVCLMAAALCFCRCGSEGEKSLSSDAREIKLISDYTEISANSSKVPGYWGRQFGDGRKVFLYTLDRAYKKGEVIMVEGPYGTAMAAVFDDKTRVYESGQATIIIVVRKAVRSGSGEGGPSAPAKGPGR